jgi:hypothetical protein
MTLPDATAIHILKTIAQARLRPAAPDPALTPELRAALGSAIGAAAAPVSEADLARAALDVLAEDPEFAEPIRIMSREEAAPAQRFIDPGTIAIATAAILVLQTRFKGKWNHIEIEKKALGDAALKLLIQRLLPFLPGK